MEFYYHIIANLRTADEIEENNGADTLGNSVHEVLEALYKPTIGKKLIFVLLVEMQKKSEELIIDTFEKTYSRSEISYGKNLLTIKVASKFITNFLKREQHEVAKAEKSGHPNLIKE